MTELNVDTSPLPFAAGYKLYWFVALVIYVAMFGCMLHYKIFHTAS